MVWLPWNEKQTYRLNSKASNVAIRFDLCHDLDLEFSRSNIEFPISQPKVVRLPRNEKQTYRLNSRPQIWPMGLILTITLTFRILKVKCDLHLWPHTWPWPWIFMVKFWNSCISEWEGRLTLHKGGGSRSFITMPMTIWWPRSGVWIYQIVTGVTSVVGMPSTHLVSYLVITGWQLSRPLLEPLVTLYTDTHMYEHALISSYLACFFSHQLSFVIFNNHFTSFPEEIFLYIHIYSWPCRYLHTLLIVCIILCFVNLGASVCTLPLLPLPVWHHGNRKRCCPGTWWKTFQTLAQGEMIHQANQHQLGLCIDFSQLNRLSDQMPNDIVSFLYSTLLLALVFYHC